MTVLLAAKQRQKPNGERPPLEKCPQTPGLYLRRIASKCRVDGCATNSRSRLCEEHYLQLMTQKVKSLPCTLAAATKYAVYQTTPAAGPKPEWKGITIRDAKDVPTPE